MKQSQINRINIIANTLVDGTPATEGNESHEGNVAVLVGVVGGNGVLRRYAHESVPVAQLVDWAAAKPGRIALMWAPGMAAVRVSDKAMAFALAHRPDPNAQPVMKYQAAVLATLEIAVDQKAMAQQTQADKAAAMAAELKAQRSARSKEAWARRKAAQQTQAVA